MSTKLVYYLQFQMKLYAKSMNIRRMTGKFAGFPAGKCEKNDTIPDPPPAGEIDSQKCFHFQDVLRYLLSCNPGRCLL
jgi:hypothetical protein